MQFSLISYNIDSGKGPDGICVPENSMKVLKEASPDVIALQEVASFRPGCPQIDYLARAETFLGMASAFGKTLDFENGGTFGNGILSRFPVETVEVFPLDFPPEAEKRKALITKIAAPSPFFMVSLHLSYQGEFENDDEARKEALKKLEQHLMEKRYFPVILAGDFNNGPDSPAISFMREKWDIANDTAKERIPTAETGKYGWMQIDFIMSYPKGAFACKKFQVMEDFYGPSDHRGVFAELEFSGK
ncbi:MAG: endonuclease/exonuclease/phosphatase family protein [Lentisphaeria bacterium]|nr:endonuclease/exonuclease/phosphatase family protein [Lentisphaeria bacterium]